MASFWKALHDVSSRSGKRRLPLGILCAAAGNAVIAGVNHVTETPFHGNGAAAVLGIAIAYLFGVEAAAAGMAGYFVTAHFAWVVPGDFSVMTEAGKAMGLFYAVSMAWAIWLANRARDFVNSATMSRAIVEEERQILKLIATNLPLGEILARLTGSIELLSPGVKCAVMALEADGQLLSPAAAPSLPADYVKALHGVEIGPSALSCGAAAYLGRAVFSENIGEDPNWQCYRAIAAASGLRAAWSFPIRGSGGSILGSFCVYAAEPGRPEPGRRKIFESAAYLGGIAMERKRAERDIQQKRRFIEAMLESVQVGMAACNPSGQVTLHNNAIKTILGAASLPVSIEEWPKHFTVYQPGCSTPIPESASPLARAFNGEMLDNLEAVVEPKGGSRRTVLVNGRPILDSDGKRLGAVVSLSDVTDRKRADALLRESEDRYRSFVETTNDFLFAITPKGEITYGNRAAKEVLGYSPEELLGIDSFELFHPNDRQAAKQALDKCAAVKEGWRNLTGRYRHKDGGYRYLESSGAPILTEGGELIGFRGTDRDVTERVEATELLRRSSESYQLLFEGIPQPAWVHDRETLRFLAVNRATEQTYGYSREQLMGMTAKDIVAETELAGLNPDDWGRDPARSWKHRRAGGGEFLVELKSYSIELEGRPATLILANDVTERKKMKRELEVALNKALEATRAKDEFLAKMSHEIRTPLNGALGMMHLLERTALDPEQRQLCGAARGSAEHMLGLIGDILDLSKIEAGDLDLSCSDFDPRQVTLEVVDLLGEEARRKGIQVASAAPPLPLVKGDAGRLRQVLLNLVGNAVKFTKDGSVIVRARVAASDATGLTLRFEVKDSGCGVEPALMKDLFQSFTHSGSAVKRRHRGAGLGLAIARELVRMMGGEIGVESEPSAGSLFWFTARFMAAAAVPPDEKALRNPVYICCPGDPNESVLLETIEAWGVAAVTVASTAAMDADGNSGASVFFYALPEDDEAAAREIATLRLSYRGHIHALTRDWGAEARERAALCGCDGFLAMPFRQGSLRRLLELPAGAGEKPGRADDRPACRGTVLVAEDNAVNQLVTSRILQQLGYAVEIVADGRAAVAAVENGRFDLVLMDCEMPEMDGFEAAAAIRSRPVEQIPIIALTAHAIKGYKELCLAAGMDGYLSKPVRLAELSLALERWMPPRAEAADPQLARGA